MGEAGGRYVRGCEPSCGQRTAPGGGEASGNKGEEHKCYRRVRTGKLKVRV